MQFAVNSMGFAFFVFNILTISFVADLNKHDIAKEGFELQIKKSPKSKT